MCAARTDGDRGGLDGAPQKQVTEPYPQLQAVSGVIRESGERTQPTPASAPVCGAAPRGSRAFVPPSRARVRETRRCRRAGRVGCDNGRERRAFFRKGRSICDVECSPVRRLGSICDAECSPGRRRESICDDLGSIGDRKCSPVRRLGSIRDRKCSSVCRLASIRDRKCSSVCRLASICDDLGSIARVGGEFFRRAESISIHLSGARRLKCCVRGGTALPSRASGGGQRANSDRLTPFPRASRSTSVPAPQYTVSPARHGAWRGREMRARRRHRRRLRAPRGQWSRRPRGGRA